MHKEQPRTNIVNHSFYVCFLSLMLVQNLYFLYKKKSTFDGDDIKKITWDNKPSVTVEEPAFVVLNIICAHYRVTYP